MGRQDCGRTITPITTVRTFGIRTETRSACAATIPPERNINPKILDRLRPPVTQHRLQRIVELAYFSKLITAQ